MNKLLQAGSGDRGSKVRLLICNTNACLSYFQHNAWMEHLQNYGKEKEEEKLLLMNLHKRSWFFHMPNKIICLFSPVVTSGVMMALQPHFLRHNIFQLGITILDLVKFIRAKIVVPKSHEISWDTRFQYQTGRRKVGPMGDILWHLKVYIFYSGCSQGSGRGPLQFCCLGFFSWRCVCLHAQHVQLLNIQNRSRYIEYKTC